jgi:hypothetical protein
MARDPRRYPLEVPRLAPGACMGTLMQSRSVSDGMVGTLIQARSASDGISYDQTSASGSVASPNVFCGTPILSSIER